MLAILFWLLLLIGAFLFNLLGMMQLIPRVVTIPVLFFVIFLFVYTLTQKNSIRRH